MAVRSPNCVRYRAAASGRPRRAASRHRRCDRSVAVTSNAASRGMLDTSTVILLGRISDPAALPDEAVISAITLAELSVGPHVARTAKERAARQAHLQQAESDFDVLAFDAESARAF